MHSKEWAQETKIVAIRVPVGDCRAHEIVTCGVYDIIARASPFLVITFLQFGVEFYMEIPKKLFFQNRLFVGFPSTFAYQIRIFEYQMFENQIVLFDSYLKLKYLHTLSTRFDWSLCNRTHFLFQSTFFLQSICFLVFPVVFFIFYFLHLQDYDSPTLFHFLFCPCF